MERKRLTDEGRGRIKGLHEAGLDYRAISDLVDRSISVISRVLEPRTEPKASGRPLKLCERAVRRVVRRASGGHTSSTKLKAEFDLECSARTVWRVLANTDYLVYAKMDQTLDQTAAHKAHRLAWAKTQLTTARDWKTVVLSDEKRFNRDGPDGFKHFWKDVRHPSRSYNKHQQGGGGIIVWGGMSWEGKTVLAILEGRQASEEYIYTVSQYMLPFAHLNHETEFVFQQDNAPIHSSKLTKGFFSEMAIEVLDWPARSPDLNPIENLWAAMSRRVYDDGKQYDTLPLLRNAILDAWESNTLDEIRTLIDSMPRRCIETIERKGDKTHY